MFGPSMGTWSVSSENDPKWNGMGMAEGLVTLGGPPEIQEHIEECKKKYGDQPEDLSCSFFKD